MTTAAEFRERFAKVLTDHAIAPNVDGFHGWRCEYPDRYPDYCHCVPDLLDDLVAVVVPVVSPITASREDAE